MVIFLAISVRVCNYLIKGGGLMKNIGKYITSGGTALFFLAIGIIIQMIRPQGSMVIGVLSVASALPVVLFILNIVLAKKEINKLKATKVADVQSYMLRHKKEAEQASGNLLSQVSRLRHLTVVYTVIVGVLAVCIAVLGGILYVYESTFGFAFLVYSGLVFYAVYSRIPNYKIEPFGDDVMRLSREEYPKIYSLADNAAEKLGCSKDITIILSLDCNATVYITDGGKKCTVMLGIILLNIMTEDEVYCIFLHELSHVSPKNRSFIREGQYNSWLQRHTDASSVVDSILSHLYMWFDCLYLFNYLTYYYAYSVVRETEADRDMVRYGDIRAAASSLLKLQYDNMRYWESGVRDEAPFYKSEEQPTDYLNSVVKKFRATIQERKDDWNELVGKEILANNATHPTLKMRLNTLGVEELEIVEDISSQAYCEESQKALDYAEKKRYAENEKTYSKDRKTYYTEPLERITDWENNGCAIDAESYADIISDLKQIGRNEQAEALCDRAIEELDEHSAMHAYFIKGSAMLYRYDEKGLELVYHAIENNQNYLEEGLNVIGRFCCLTGREKELLKYRECAVKLQQKNVDENSKAGFLSKHDNLTKENLPEGMLENILSFIHSVDSGNIIENIYLVRKTISESFFSSVFVIHFYGGTSAQQNEIMHKIFRYLDSYPIDWQFSLFDYFSYPEVKIEKIEGSLVYSKSNNKGE